MKIVTWTDSNGLERVSLPSPELRNSLGDAEAAQYVAGNDLPADANNVSIVDEADFTEPLRFSQESLKRQAEREYQETLERGFTFDGGTFSATGPKRARVVELVTGHNASKGLPRGKVSKTFHDKEGVAHDFNAQQIVDLAAAGSDHVEAADDRLEELYAEIQAATSHDELDAIRVDEGWPS